MGLKVRPNHPGTDDSLKVRREPGTVSGKQKTQNQRKKKKKLTKTKKNEKPSEEKKQSECVTLRGGELTLLSLGPLTLELQVSGRRGTV